MDYKRMHGTAIRIPRIFNTYGPRMLPDDGRVVSNFIVQALRGEPLTIYGDGKQTRSFYYVDDLIEGLIRLMYSDYISPVNIGNPNEFTMLQLAQLIRDKINSSLSIIHMDLPEDDPMQRQPIIEMAKKQLDWQPTIELEPGLDQTINYFKGKLKIGLSQGTMY